MELIDRQAAIDALCALCEKKKNCDKSKFVYIAPQDEQVIMCPEHYALSTLPHAQPAELETLIKALEQEHKKLREMQPKQRTGKWILDRSGAYCCSKCMEPCATYAMMKPRDKFCKMCGAKMTEGDAE